MDVSSLSNEELREQLVAHGINPGPVVATTRRVYEAKLLKAMGGVSPTSTATRSPSKSKPAAAEPHIDQIRRSRRSAAQAASAAGDEDEDEEDYEGYEGEESFRLVDSHEDLSYSAGSGGIKYRGTYGSSGDSPASKSFLSDTYTTTSYGSGSKYGSSSGSANYVSPTHKLDDNGSSKGGVSVPMWLKLLLLVALTVFIFFIFQRVIENSPPAVTGPEDQI